MPIQGSLANEKSVQKQGNRLQQITLSNGQVFSAPVSPDLRHLNYTTH